MTSRDHPATRLALETPPNRAVPPPRPAPGPARLPSGRPGRAPAPGPRSRRHAARASRWPRATASRWLLPVVLAVQALLTARLIGANTAFQDEALYLVSGHQEWSHWLHGTPLPPLQDYFSGAPVLYPPLGALADSLGGLAAARALSLCFMLTATTLLHGVTRRLFGRRSAAFAAGLFAGLGSTQFLGAFATYDALALTLLAAATWLGVAAASRRRAAAAAALAAAGLVLATADAAKYAAALFDPVVITVIACACWHHRGRRAGAGAALAVTITAVLALGGALAAGGPGYLRGIRFTTLARPGGSSPPQAVLLVSLGWAAAVGVLALIGAITLVCSRRRQRSAWVLAVALAGAVWLAPAEQARIATFTSLFKHVGFGEWFGAAAAGFALAALCSAIPAAKASGGCRVAWLACAASAVLGVLLAANQFSSWPDTSAVVTALRPLLNRHPVLAADNINVLTYYTDPGGLGPHEYAIGSDAQFQSGFSASSLTVTEPRSGRKVTGAAAYRLAVGSGRFGVIALSGYPAWREADAAIRHDIRRSRDYRLAAAIPYTAGGRRHVYQLWVHRGAR